MIDKPPLAHALTRFALNSHDARRLVHFYERACGARLQTRRRMDTGNSAPWKGIRGSAESTLLTLGDATIELLEFDSPGRPYPPDVSPYDTRFQHLCIVVTDMQRAMERLRQVDGWSSISHGGAQTLPGGDGGVTAFKFRDPDGHPLEFLQFATGKVPTHWQAAVGGDVHQGIDHSALSVEDAARSVRFYESLGLRSSNRTLNRGTAQERLDGVAAPVVDVITLAPRQATPHVELLHYRTAEWPTHDAPAANDVAATRLVFAAESASGDEAGCLLQDPDGHFLQFEWCAEV